MARLWSPRGGVGALHGAPHLVDNGAWAPHLVDNGASLISGPASWGATQLHGGQPRYPLWTTRLLGGPHPVNNGDNGASWGLYSGEAWSQGWKGSNSTVIAPWLANRREESFPG